MTPVFCCGFECGATSHWNVAGPVSYNTNASFIRSGARSLRGNFSAQTSNASTYFTMSTNKMVLRFYVYFATLPTTNSVFLLAGGDPSANSAGAYFNVSDNKIYARAKTTSGATGIPVQTGVWYLVDTKIDISANPWLCDVKINDVSCGQASSATAASTFDRIWLFNSNVNNWSGDVYFDDVLESETLADYPLGAGYINHFVPTSDGTHNVASTADFKRTQTGTDILNATTTAYQLVDTIPLETTLTEYINMIAPVNATDYVECVFGAAPGISIPVNPPRAVEVIGMISTDSAGGSPTMDLSFRLNDNGTIDDIFVSTAFYQPTTAAAKRKCYATAPSTSAAWTTALFNALKIRYGSYDAADSAPDGWFGSTMIEAEFADPIPNKIVRVRQAVNRSNSY